MQNEGREDQGRDRVEIAHERDGLRRQAHHGPEIHRIGDRRMRQRHQKHQSGGQRRQMQTGEAARQRQIRCHDQSRRAKLHDGLIVCVQRGERLAVHGGDGGI